MNNNQYKKLQAKLHNLRRDERLAYEMHYKMYPEQKPLRCIGASSKNNLLTHMAVAASLGFSL